MAEFRIKDPALRKRAEEELGETDELRKDSLKQLRTLIEDDPRICGKISDELLVAYLRTAKFDANAAYTRVKNFAKTLMHPTARNMKQQYSRKEKILSTLNQTWIMYPAGYDDKMRKVLTILGGYRWDPDVISLEEVGTAFVWLLLSEVLDERSQIGGFVFILDCTRAGVKQCKAFMSPSLLYLLGSLLKDCLPVRMKQIHITNVSVIPRTITSIFLSFVGHKIRERFQVHGGGVSGEKIGVPARLLSPEFGGTCLSTLETSYFTGVIENAEKLGLIQSLRCLEYV